jgi:2-amino-4-hydroxy-6-hydroxymethyldihydropteridine diphosphokinase
MSTVYISLGSNLCSREQHLHDAKVAIRNSVGSILAESSIYDNEAVGFDGEPFLNQVVKVETLLSSENLLQKTQEIEKKLGRNQKTVMNNGKPVYSDRIIDIDILLYDNLQIDTETLTIPHPRMFKREFVMKLLEEVRNTNDNDQKVNEAKKVVVN